MYKLFKRKHVPGRFEVQMAGGCDVGSSRELNEDAIGIDSGDDRGYYLAIVCDGMGGHSAGEVASALAVDVITRHVQEFFSVSDPAVLLHDACIRASRQIDEHAELNSEVQGMGCTTVIVLGVEQKLVIANVGDSRAYRVDKENFEQLTSDHTMVQEMIDEGILTLEQAATHPYRGRISACLGHGKNKCEPTITETTLACGENILLCSDGLSDVVPDEEVHALVQQRHLRDAIERLVDAANEHGGPDNISAVLLRRRV